jgi:hypothetical protein
VKAAGFCRPPFLCRLAAVKSPPSLLAVLCAALLAAGCEHGPAADLADYRVRVQRASGVDVRAPAPLVLPAYPPHRERAVPIPEVRGSVWELLFDLPDCDLGHLVSERNSILGRYWPATSRFDYELRFGLRLDRCRARLAARPPADEAERDFRARLDEIHLAKQHTLAAAWWALSYDSVEFERAFSPAAPALSAATADSAAHDALEYLIALSAQLDTPGDGIDLAALERSLQQLAVSQYGGALLRSLGLLVAELDAASAALETARPCPQQRPTPQARVLHTVFTQYYAGRTQPYMAAVQRGGQRWLELHAHLLARQQVELPPAFARFRARALAVDGDSLWRRWQQARDRHVQAWQQVLGACGLMPGRVGQPAFSAVSTIMAAVSPPGDRP